MLLSSKLKNNFADWLYWIMVPLILARMTGFGSASEKAAIILLFSNSRSFLSFSSFFFSDKCFLWAGIKNLRDINQEKKTNTIIINRQKYIGLYGLLNDLR
jgi:hypothetical protein